MRFETDAEGNSVYKMTDEEIAHQSMAIKTTHLAFRKNFEYALKVLTWVVVAFVCTHITSGLLLRDDSDGDEMFEKSGFAVRTDYGTGCQYLITPAGLAFPRMAADGRRHAGCRSAE